MTDQFIVTDLGAAYIRHHACRWPIGDPAAADFRFCGGQVERGAFCHDHRAKPTNPVLQDPIRSWR